VSSLLSLVGLATARRATHLADRLQSAEQRAAELKQSVADAREEAQRWKKKAAELTQQLARFEKDAERLPRVERELAKCQERDALHLEQLRGTKDLVKRVSQEVALSQDHLLATETKLDVIEGAITVLDLRTRTRP